MRAVCLLCRTAAGAVHDPRSVSVALRRVVLPLQNVPHGNDVIGVDPDHRRVHGRALPGHLSLAARPGHVGPVAGRARGGRRVGGGVRDGRSVPDTHPHLPLPPASGNRAPACRLSYLHNTQPVDAQHEIRLSGTFLHRYAIASTFCPFLNRYLRHFWRGTVFTAVCLFVGLLAE